MCASVFPESLVHDNCTMPSARIHSFQLGFLGCNQVKPYARGRLQGATTSFPATAWGGGPGFRRVQGFRVGHAGPPWGFSAIQYHGAVERSMGQEIEFC